jgi:riboflavin kinase/FMN adenylyltransferase
MRIIRHPRRKSLKGCVVALGTFDGVHRGHQAVIRKAVAFSKKIKACSLALTFDPHPQQLIVPKRGLKLLTTLKEREELFYRQGIEGVLVIKFSQHLRKLSYERFIKNYLVNRLGVSRVFVGYDFAFGHGRAGDVSNLRQLGEKYGFQVTVVPPVVANHRHIKSSNIRELVSRGSFSEALRLLGHPYPISGRVVRGMGRGKELGFPTANLQVDDHKLIPAQGVYAGRVEGKKCAVNIGSRPTFGVDHTLVEVYILNFKGNLRRKTIKVDLIKKLRSEIQFSDVEDLKEQIKKDILKVKRL